MAGRLRGMSVHAMMLSTRSGVLRIRLAISSISTPSADMLSTHRSMGRKCSIRLQFFVASTLPTLGALG